MSDLPTPCGGLLKFLLSIGRNFPRLQNTLGEVRHIFNEEI